MGHNHKHNRCKETGSPYCDACCNSGALHAFYKQASEAFLSRRHLIAGMGAAAVGSWSLTRRAKAAEATPVPAPTIAPAKELIVQPVLTYSIHQRREKTSWRPWGGLMSASDVEAEVNRINQELRQMVASRGLAIKLLPVEKVASPDEAARIRETACDVMLVYASGNQNQTLEALIKPDRPTLVFLRHRSGPISLWYETLHPRFMRKDVDELGQPRVDFDDVVVDEYADLEWRLRALLGLRRTLGQRIVAVGGAGGWSVGGQIAPKIAREKWKLDIRDFSYDELGKRINKMRQDKKAVAEATKQADAYLGDSSVKMHTNRQAVDNAFLLARIFKDILKEQDATAITINSCMGTIIPMAETTACLPLSLLNDDGYLAFCESDFVVIPSGILMHHITGLPVFLNDPTWPHHGIVTVAHCTAPRKMNGKTLDPVDIHTHFESDYGAAPKVEMPKGQKITMVVPDFSACKWVGFTGEVIENPFHDICRSQMDVTIEGDWEKLLKDMQGFHWMMVNSDCRREIGYAIKHVGIEWEDVSA